MVCTSFSLSSASPVGPAATMDVHRHHDGLRRSNSASELRCDRAGIRRSRSEPQLRWSMTVGRAAATEPTRMKTSRPIAMFPFSLSSFIRSFLFDSEDESGKGMRLVEPDEGELEPGPDEAETEKRVNWVERVLELRNRWRDRQQKEEEKPEEKEEEKEIGECACGCGVSYDTDDEGEEEPKWDMESFSKLLAPVGRSDTKLFSKLAFLCNKAYVIPEIKVHLSNLTVPSGRFLLPLSPNINSSYVVGFVRCKKVISFRRLCI